MSMNIYKCNPGDPIDQEGQRNTKSMISHQPPLPTEVQQYDQSDVYPYRGTRIEHEIFNL